MDVMETCVKTDGGYTFVGWSNPNSKDEFCMDVKETKKFIYKTYKYLTGNIEVYRYRKVGV